MVSHRERIEICLSGEKPDRIPIALWRHFPVDDQTPEGLANATLHFQKTFDFDIVKVSPSSSFCLKDWGARDEWRGSSEGTREYINRVITKPDDFGKLPILDPEKGFLADQITCLRLLFNELGPSTPIIQTVFNPLSQAKNLVGKGNLNVYIRKYPEALHEGLEKITETTRRFIEAIKLTGVAGIFYAVQHGQFGILTQEEYEEFGKSYDLQVLEAADEMWLNMLHIHGQDVMFKLFLDYPINVINWHDRETYPSLVEAKEIWSGTICGGLSRKSSMVLGTPQSVNSDTLRAIDETNGIRLILGTGCVLPITVPYGNIISARQSVDYL